MFKLMNFYLKMKKKNIKSSVDIVVDRYSEKTNLLPDKFGKYKIR